MSFLWEGLLAITWQQVVMYIVGGVLIYLAICKDFEPALLMPMGFGAILVNLPFSGVLDQTMQGVGETHGIIQWLFNVGIETSEALPILLFIGIGAMIDFGPLLSNPKMFLFGAAAQFGIFFAIAAATLLGFDLKDAASIGIIGAADGPTSILVSQVLGSKYVGAIAVAAYSYMALVPIIQPVVIKAITTKKERLIRMPHVKAKTISKRTRILFPILVTLIAGLVAPMSVSLVGFLMFGNLLRECGVLKRLSETAQNEFANIITLLLGITISFSMRAEQFVTLNTLMIIIQTISRQRKRRKAVKSMKEYGKVRSTKQPEQKVIDDYSVWVAANITPVTEAGTDEQPGFTGYEYDLTQYTKDEYIKMIDDRNASLEDQMTQAQEAMCEIYEMMA